MTDVEMTGVHRWRRFLIQLLTPTEPQLAPTDAPGVYRSGQHAGAQDRTVRIGGPQALRRPAPAAPVPPRQPDISLEQATRRIPLLDQVCAQLGMSEQEAAIYNQLAGNWRALPVDEGPATDHTADAVRLPAFDREGGEHRA